MTVNVTPDPAVAELIDRHRALYNGPDIDAKLDRLIRMGPSPKLSAWDVQRLLRAAQAVFFDTHVEVVSGHHTATYLRFDSIAHVPQLVRLLAGDMAEWIVRTYAGDPVTGLLATRSSAEQLAVGVAEALHERMRLRVVLTPYDQETGKIGTEIIAGAIHRGDRFIALNDVTTRGNCVSKLGKVVTDHGAELAGLMVFARRDSGQFPLVDELAARHPFYYTAALDMPQWDRDRCPLCRNRQPLLSWRDMPQL